MQKFWKKSRSLVQTPVKNLFYVKTFDLLTIMIVQAFYANPDLQLH